MHKHNRAKITRAWHILRKTCTVRRRRWKHVFGPVAGTMSTLADLGWQPIQPNAFVDRKSVEWHITAGNDMFDFLSAVKRDAELDIWYEDAQTYMG